MWGIVYKTNIYVLFFMKGVIFAKSDIGTGTIVGSAIFNVLFIISVCALATQTVNQINLNQFIMKIILQVL
jgi:hypothetical protein